MALDFLANRWTTPPLDSLKPKDFANKNVLVTGSNTGIGIEAARHYAQLGASRVVLGVRSLDKGDAAKSDIEKSLSADSGVKIDVWLIDMASFASVKEFSEKVNQELESLDIALLNAGMATDKWDLTSDGWDKCIQVNFLSTILLGLLLLPKLKASSGHLEFVASAAHRFVQEGASWQKSLNPLTEVNKGGIFSGVERYATSKLFLIYGVREISKLVLDSDNNPMVIVNYSCPGYCKTELSRETEGFLKVIVGVLEAALGKTAEQGARTLVLASNVGPDGHGRWFYRTKITE
jgi:NAD(P)-dependent dehydrogenase (short-subunit alcohol dehydrogenase family)